VFWFRTCYLKNNAFLKCRKFKYSKWHLFLFNTYAQPSTIYNRKIFQEVGLFEEQYKIVMDTEFLLRTEKNGYSIKGCKANLSIMRLDGISSRYIKNTIQESKNVRMKYTGLVFTYLFLFQRNLRLFIKKMIKL